MLLSNSFFSIGAIIFSMISSGYIYGHNINQNNMNNVDHDIKVSEEEVVKIIEFWNGLNCIYAHFIQQNENGDQLKGILWLKKAKGSKARMRLDYKEGVKQRIFLKDSEISILDLEDNSLSSYPLSMTPLDLIVNPHLVLGKDVALIKAIRRKDVVEMVLAPSSDSQVSLTLFLKMQSGIQFLGWRVVDAQDAVTIVMLESDSIRLNDKKTVEESIFNIQ